MACDVQEILSASACRAAFLEGQLDQAEVLLLCAINTFLTDGTTMACDVQSLLSETPCISGFTKGQLQVVKVQLLCDILTTLGGGGGGSGCSIFAKRHAVSFGGLSPDEMGVEGCQGEVLVNLDNGDRFVFAGTDGTSVGWV